MKQSFYGRIKLRHRRIYTKSYLIFYQLIFITQVITLNIIFVKSIYYLVYDYSDHV